MKAPVRARWAVGLAAAFAANPVVGQSVPLRTELVTGGVNAPVFVTSPPGDSRLFIVQQDGDIRVFKNGVLLAAPFLALPVFYSGESGLLGLAFHPDYATNGTFFVYASQNHETLIGDKVLKYTVRPDNPDLADSASRSTVIVTGTVGLHNGGWIGFSPVDGYLWIASGDRSVDANSANLTNAMGKMLRIDPMEDDFPADPNRNFKLPPDNPLVSVPGLAWEIHDLGLRNPWRCSFDRLTGDLWIGDVGHVSNGEINFQPVDAVAPRDYGWPVCDSGSTNVNCAKDGRIPHAWAPPRTGCATAGGYIYRGAGLPGWQGQYFAGDYCSGSIWTMLIDRATQTATNVEERTMWLSPPNNSISSFGEDAFGELYICRLGYDSVYRIVPAVPVGPDCNRNGVRDALEIARGSLPDANHDGIPDGCPACRADFNNSGGVSVQDIYDFLEAWNGGQAAADFNGENAVTVQDIYDYLTAWSQACGG